MIQKTKVLQISNRFIIGGPSIILTVLHAHLGENFISKLLVGKKEPHEEDAKFLLHAQGVSCEEIPSMNRTVNPISDLKAYYQIKKIIKSFKPQIVHTHAAKPSVLGRLAAHFNNVPVVLHTYHGHVFHNYFGKITTFFVIGLERFLTKFTSKIIAISEQQKEELVNIYKICKADKVVVIPLGLDLSPFYTDQPEKRIGFRKKFDIKDDEIVIAIVGRLVAVKNHTLFISAISEVLINTTKKIRVLIVGDGDERINLIRQLDELKIPFNYHPDDKNNKLVTLTSWLTKMDEVYAGVDIVALSSLNEGTPVALIEAQAACKPIVTTDVGGIRDIILKNETAFCVPSNEVKTFSASLCQLIENDELRLKMGKKGYIHVKNNFDKSIFLNNTRTLYIKLLKEKGIEYI